MATMKHTLALLIAGLMLTSCSGGTETAGQTSSVVSQADLQARLAQAKALLESCDEETDNAIACSHLSKAIRDMKSATQDSELLALQALTAAVREVGEAKENCVKHVLDSQLAPEVSRAHTMIRQADEAVTRAQGKIADTALIDAVKAQRDSLSAFLDQVESEQDSYACPKAHDVVSDVLDRQGDLSQMISSLTGALAAATIDFH